MNITVSNVLATSVWMAFLSVLAIIGIIVAGGFIVALIGRMVLSLFNAGTSNETDKVDEFGYVQTNTNQSALSYTSWNLAMELRLKSFSLNVL